MRRVIVLTARRESSSRSRESLDSRRFAGLTASAKATAVRRSFTRRRNTCGYNFHHGLLSALMMVGALTIVVAGYHGPEQEPKTLRMHTLDVSDNLYLLTGGGGNTLALMADSGVVVIDTKLAGWGQPLLAAVSAVTEKPVTTIINTHAHPDHTGSNRELATAVDIIAHENTKENMRRMDAFKGPSAKALPNKTYMERLSLLEGIDRIDLYYFGAGHTNGDAVVVFPAKGVAYLGDLFPSKAAPFIDASNGGSGVLLPETLTKIVAELKDKNINKVIPGHDTASPGSSRRWLTWNDLQEYADFNRDFLAAVQEAIKAGKSEDQAVAELRMPEKYKDYDMDRARANVQAIYDELRK